MAKELPYFRWFPKDAESDAKYAAMSLTELGLYHRCLNHSWMNDGLPGDPQEIARELRVPIKDFIRHWPRVSACFAGEDRMRNPRQEQERAHARTKSEQASDAVKKRIERSSGDSSDDRSSDPPRAYGSDMYTPSSSENASEQKNSSLRRESDSWFAGEFWPIWPVKVNKEPARRACLKIKPEQRPDVLRGVREQSAHIAAMERPIHAATWLNDKRWEDEPGAVKSAESRNGTGSLFPPKKSATESMMAVVHKRIALGMEPL